MEHHGVYCMQLCKHADSLLTTLHHPRWYNYELYMQLYQLIARTKQTLHEAQSRHEDAKQRKVKQSKAAFKKKALLLRRSR